MAGLGIFISGQCKPAVGCFGRDSFRSATWLALVPGRPHVVSQRRFRTEGVRWGHAKPEGANMYKRIAAVLLLAAPLAVPMACADVVELSPDLYLAIRA